MLTINNITLKHTSIASKLNYQSLKKLKIFTSFSLAKALTFISMITLFYTNNCYSGDLLKGENSYDSPPMMREQGLNPRTIVQDPEPAGDQRIEEDLVFSVKYYCEPTQVIYSGIGFVYLRTSDNQELVTGNWGQGIEIPLNDRLQQSSELIVKRGKQALTITMKHIRQIQPLKFIKNWNNVPLSQFNVWAGSSMEFKLSADDLCDHNGKPKGSELIIEFLTPNGEEGIFLRFR